LTRSNHPVYIFGIIWNSDDFVSDDLRIRHQAYISLDLIHVYIRISSCSQLTGKGGEITVIIKVALVVFLARVYVLMDIGKGD